MIDTGAMACFVTCGDYANSHSRTAASWQVGASGDSGEYQHLRWQTPTCDIPGYQARTGRPHRPGYNLASGNSPSSLWFHTPILTGQGSRGWDICCVDVECFALKRYHAISINPLDGASSRSLGHFGRFPGPIPLWGTLLFLKSL
jgi:hypothetical protein